MSLALVADGPTPVRTISIAEGDLWEDYADEWENPPTPTVLSTPDWHKVKCLGLPPWITRTVCTDGGGGLESYLPFAGARW